MDNIDETVNNINKKVSLLDSRMTSLESKMSESNRKFVEIEASRAYDSQVCDYIKTKQSAIDKQLKSDQQIKQNLMSDIQNLKKENNRISMVA